MLQNAVRVFLHVPVCIPPFFFKRQAQTTIQLAVSPAPLPPSDCVSLVQGTDVIFKVEGVVRRRAANMARDIDKVHLRLTCSVKECVCLFCLHTHTYIHTYIHTHSLTHTHTHTAMSGPMTLRLPSLCGLCSSFSLPPLRFHLQTQRSCPFSRSGFML